MCGIFVHGHQLQTPQACPAHCDDLRRMNAARGPDAQNELTLYYPGGHVEHDGLPVLSVAYYGSELRLRGDADIQQPHVRGKNVLCWNGEIFEGLEIGAHENDGAVIFDKLCGLITPEEVCDLFSHVEGPYAFVLYHEPSRKLYFGKDPLGRRSLLLQRPTEEQPSFVISSVSSSHLFSRNVEEVSCSHIFSLDLDDLASGDLVSRWDVCVKALDRTQPGSSALFAKTPTLSIEIPPADAPLSSSMDDIPAEFSQVVEDFLTRLDNAVFLRVKDIPRVGIQEGQARVSVLFSGGIDSTVVTYLASRHIPVTEPIDLFNVAFENPRKIRVQREGNFGGVPHRRKNKGSSTSDHNKKEATPTPYDWKVPDRVTGLRELEELRRLCPGRVFNFVEVNVSYEEAQAIQPLLETLMAPGRTVMDLSLALALYFASRGIGQVRQTPDSPPEPYSSPARVVLSGLGSDELLGGYIRHRRAYELGSWDAVIKELQLEIDRIPTRNLGRDDRIISSHGKEMRHPFLSLSLVRFLAGLPVHMKTDPRLLVGFGDKMLLRVATKRLGLVEASAREKKAMQFGSHSARMGEGQKRGDVELDS